MTPTQVPPISSNNPPPMLDQPMVRLWLRCSSYVRVLEPPRPRRPDLVVVHVSPGDITLLLHVTSEELTSCTPKMSIPVPKISPIRM
ncbi:hypothetical protein ACH46_13595 [Gordonia phthalatica]|uniref:Uncharacterized protein n=1 Tax=Gordonia phthalatica TaxID=1136941 RepID=A0A0N9N4I1_9ACTN|nr:hypothetical protein ACH46_13595 [Gordonia phthalatica]